MPLNKEQQQIIYFPLDKPLLVYAGPGSGKTEVIARKIVRIIKESKTPKFLALTFGHNASLNIKKRVLAILEQENFVFPESFNLSNHIKTFHSFSYAHSRIYAEKYIFKKPVAYFQNIKEKSKALLDIAIKEEIKNPSANSPCAKQDIKSLITLLQLEHYKNNLQKISFEEELELKNNYIQEYLANKELNEKISDEEIKKILINYEKSTKSKKFITFEQSLVYCRDYFVEDPEYAKKVSEEYEYILVDELQDVNFIQLKIIISLLEAKKSESFFCVGDPSQAIFGFSGGTPKVFNLFVETYKQATKMSLSQNYRSSKKIVALANLFIDGKSDDQGYKTDLFTENEDSGKLICFQKKTLENEVEEVISLIKEHLSTTKDQEIVVLSRCKQKNELLKNSLQEQKIKFLDLQSDEFELTAQLKAIIYLATYITCHEIDPELAEKSISYFYAFPSKKIGAVGWKQILSISENEKKSIKEVLQSIQEREEYLTKKAFKEGCELLLKELNDAESKKADNCLDALEMAYELTGLNFLWNLKESNWNIENYEKYKEKLISITQAFESLSLHKMFEKSLISNKQFQAIQEEGEDEDEKVRLFISTIHSAKGLEFDVVFLIDVSYEVLPHNRNWNNERTLLEEANLLYVAITRAKKYLYISGNTKKTKSSTFQPNDTPSFYKEIEEKVNEINQTSFK